MTLGGKSILYRGTRQRRWGAQGPHSCQGRGRAGSCGAQHKSLANTGKCMAHFAMTRATECGSHFASRVESLVQMYVPWAGITTTDFCPMAHGRSRHAWRTWQSTGCIVWKYHFNYMCHGWHNYYRLLPPGALALQACVAHLAKYGLPVDERPPLWNVCCPSDGGKVSFSQSETCAK